jgi:hypothetical protein
MKHLAFFLLLPSCSLELGCNTNIDHNRWCFRLETFEYSVESNIRECKIPSCVDWNRKHLYLLEKACAEERRREIE